MESLAADRGARRFVERRRRDVAVVCLSDRFGGRWGGMLAEANRHRVRSGWRFLTYLSLNFVLAPKLAGWLGAGSLARTCRKLEIPVLRVADINAPETHRRLREHGVQLLVSFYFDQILTAETIELASQGAVNVHPSPLPDWRGPFPLVHMAADGRDEGAVTVHRIDGPALDAGPVLAQKPLSFVPESSVLGREHHCFAVGAELLEQTLDTLESRDAAARPQGAGSYQSFPDRRTVATLLRRGVRLWSIRDLSGGA